jgi:hypothetical protein
VGESGLTFSLAVPILGYRHAPALFLPFFAHKVPILGTFP